MPTNPLAATVTISAELFATVITFVVVVVASLLTNKVSAVAAPSSTKRTS